MKDFLEYIRYAINIEKKKQEKKGIAPEFLICGPVLFSVIFYLMYTIELLCAYSGKEVYYIIAYFASSLKLIFFLGALLVGCFKYYDPYMMMVYKYNIVVFIMEGICMFTSFYIYNYINYINSLNLDKRIMALLIETIFIIATILIYKKEFYILKNIDVRTNNKLKEIYYIECNKHEKEEITKAMQICKKDIVKYLTMNSIIVLILSRTNLWILGILYIISFSRFMFNKYKFIFKLSYRKKAIVNNVLCNVVASVGHILIILVESNIINVQFLRNIGYIGLVIFSYIPFMICYLKLDELYRRAGCNKNIV